MMIPVHTVSAWKLGKDAKTRSKDKKYKKCDFFSE